MSDSLMDSTSVVRIADFCSCKIGIHCILAVQFELTVRQKSLILTQLLNEFFSRCEYVALPRFY